MAAPENARILVADDDRMIRFMLAEVLREDGHEVIEAGDGKEAAVLFVEHRPDLVVLDVVMPRLDGYGACRSIRETRGGQDVPIIVLTGIEDPSATFKAFDAGATDFATKPIHWVTFRQRIRFLLRAQRTLEDLRRSEARLEAAQRISRLGTFEVDVDRDTVWLTREAARLLGVEARDGTLAYAAFLERFHADDRSEVDTSLGRVRAGAPPMPFECRVGPDGNAEYVEIHAARSSGTHTAMPAIAGTIQDISERRESEHRIRFLAYYDSLTGLPNRAFFQEAMRAELARSRRQGRMLAVLFIDVDRFKRINDSLGHTAGDRVLQHVAQRFRDVVRAEDMLSWAGGAETPTIARLGGDEFILAVGDLVHVDDAAHVATRVLESLQEPIRIDKDELVVSASIGISVYPRDSLDLDSLLKNADAALHRAKDAGRDNFKFYDPTMSAAAVLRLTTEAHLRRAIDRREFELYYQPQVDVSRGAIVAVEALLRWHHPEWGLVEPMRFVPIAEELGLIHPLGRWVIDEACRQIRHWRETGLGLVRVAVNVSPRQFRSHTLVDDVETALSHHGIPANLLELEITESTLMDNTMETTSALRRLKACGLRIAMDDFGTGYSSLTYLNRLPLDVLKIDRSFLKDIAAGTDDAMIVTAILAMARSLRLDCIAEGVETEDQRAFLQRHGCELMQGFLFARPAPAAEIEPLLGSATGLPERLVGRWPP